MKKKPVARSAFFNPRFLISFALFACCALLALLSFALSPGGNARAESSQLDLQTSSLAESSQLGIQATAPVASSQETQEIAQVEPADPTGTCSWSAGPPYPVPVLDNASVTVGNMLYSFAGVSNGAIVATLTNLMEQLGRQSRHCLRRSNFLRR